MSQIQVQIWKLLLGSGQRCIPGDDENCGDGGLAKMLVYLIQKASQYQQTEQCILLDGTNIRAVDNRGDYSHFKLVIMVIIIIGVQYHVKAHCKQVKFNFSGQQILLLVLSMEVCILLDDRLVMKLTSDMKIKVVAGNPLHCNVNATYDETALGTVLAIAFSQLVIYLLLIVIQGVST
ncbi:hypothetical protein PVAND_011942 [Polypedilum vanderplanki]|uniref:Teneurin NHL domain-containing protein n=1 Tax=Polypedilum vanderplanki TaxID=319348 RepID=A0A9J6CL67_POLVA|nr:hypothetical protein PVAND_011942 [Polypedilum vanderplanki]